MKAYCSKVDRQTSIPPKQKVREVLGIRMSGKVLKDIWRGGSSIRPCLLICHLSIEGRLLLSQQRLGDRSPISLDDYTSKGKLPALWVYILTSWDVKLAGAWEIIYISKRQKGIYNLKFSKVSTLRTGRSGSYSLEEIFLKLSQAEGTLRLSSLICTLYTAFIFKAPKLACGSLKLFFIVILWLTVNATPQSDSKKGQLSSHLI